VFVYINADLAGKTDLEQAQADMIVDSFGDINEIVVDFTFHEQDKDKQVTATRIPTHMSAI
jgi:hypothetical protein